MSQRGNVFHFVLGWVAASSAMASMAYQRQLLRCGGIGLEDFLPSRFLSLDRRLAARVSSKTVGEVVGST